MGIWYATREQVMGSLEASSSTHVASLVDAKLEAASRRVESVLHRRFYPERRTLLMDWPNPSSPVPSELWLNSNEIISLESLTAGGEPIDTANVFLRRYDDLSEPPYSVLQLNLASSAAFHSGLTTQQALAIVGEFGFSSTDLSYVDGQIQDGIADDSTVFNIKPIDGQYAVGVGSLLVAGTERLIVTGRQLGDSGATITADLGNSRADSVVSISDGSIFAVGEMILIDGERMRVNDIAGNSLVVTRSFSGSALATHSSGTTVYAYHRCVVRRGVLGTTAAAHNAGTLVHAHRYPGLVNELCVAETVVLLEQNSSAYARTVGSGDNQRESAGQGLEDVRRQAYAAYGRMQRSSAV